MNDPKTSQLSSSAKYKQIDKALAHISNAYATNIEVQQIYIDLVKHTNKKIDSAFIKSIYTIFSQSKAQQICFYNEWQSCRTFDPKLLQRYYIRVLEMGIRKLSYFWQNSNNLTFILASMVKFAKQIFNMFNQIMKVNNLEYHAKILKLLEKENDVLEEKIYLLLIDEGYLASMDEFYRINGVGLVADQSYERKQKAESEMLSDDSQSETSHRQTHYSTKLQFENIGKLPQSGHSHKPFETAQPRKAPIIPSLNPNKQSPTLLTRKLQEQKNKIKSMYQSIMKALKHVVNKYQSATINEQAQRTSSKGSTASFTGNASMRWTSKRTSKLAINWQPKSRKSVVGSDTMEQFRRHQSRRVSIQILSYLSSQIKLLIEQNDQLNIGRLSSKLVSQSHSAEPLMINKLNNTKRYIDKKEYERRRNKQMIERVICNKYQNEFGKLDEMRDQLIRVTKSKNDHEAKHTLEHLPSVLMSVTENSHKESGIQKCELNNFSDISQQHRQSYTINHNDSKVKSVIRGNLQMNMRGQILNNSSLNNGLSFQGQSSMPRSAINNKQFGVKIGANSLIAEIKHSKGITKYSDNQPNRMLTKRTQTEGKQDHQNICIRSNIHRQQFANFKNEYIRGLGYCCEPQSKCSDQLFHAETNSKSGQTLQRPNNRNKRSQPINHKRTKKLTKIHQQTTCNKNQSGKYSCYEVYDLRRRRIIIR